MQSINDFKGKNAGRFNVWTSIHAKDDMSKFN